jgi:hypothetical protein
MSATEANDDALLRQWPLTIFASPYDEVSARTRLDGLLKRGELTSPPFATFATSPNARPTQIKLRLLSFSELLEEMVHPSLFDFAWKLCFKAAADYGVKEKMIEQIYHMTQTLNEAMLDESDSESSSSREQLGRDGVEDDIVKVSSTPEFAEDWIIVAFASARLFSMGYGYSIMSLNALSDGLGLSKNTQTSDTMRIGACAQLLAGGQRIKDWTFGRGSDVTTHGKLSAHWLEKRQIDNPEAFEKATFQWNGLLDALVSQQSLAGDRARTLLKVGTILIRPDST